MNLLKTLASPPSSKYDHLTHPKYRADIDGLRAIAVLSVVLFHAFPTLHSSIFPSLHIAGGFIGVDIFFVISGFLISTIIFDNLERGSFSFLEFYSRRIKRIFPALLLVLIACFVFGWFALLADEYKQLGKHIAGGAGFVSNFVFWNESGYFDNDAETKPLLHLWTLGIEEQFYIIWPLLLWAAWKRKFNLLTITVVIATISFFLNIKGVRTDPVATFYSPQTRFWELLIGSILAYMTMYKPNVFATEKQKLNVYLNTITYPHSSQANPNTFRNIQSLIGVALIVTGILTITKEGHFPGTLALLPTLGAVLIISAGQQALVNRLILSNRILVWFGLISFPLYLWHWPLLSFARIVVSETPTIKIRIAAVVISILLAWLTYKFIEKPIRFGKHSNLKTIVLALLMVGTGIIGYYTYSRDGLSFRLKEREEFIQYYENSFPTWKYFKKINLSTEWRSECAFFNGRKYLEEGKLEGGVRNSKPIDHLDSKCFKRDLRFEKAVLIWGDSHAQSIASGIVKHIPKNWQVLQIASSACSPMIGVEHPSMTSQCDQSNYFAIKTIEETKPDVIVIAQSKGHSIDNMANITRKLDELEIKKTIFLGPTPQWTAALPKIFARQLWRTKSNRTYVGIDIGILENNKKLKNNFKKNNTTEFFDVIDAFCDEKGCLTYTDDSNIKESLTTWDYGHLTPSASKWLSKSTLINQIIRD
jgi:peptidoglycan/LPS O-acetylase OafA/YrhL